MHGAHELAAGDFNNDQVADLVVLSAQGNLVYLGSSAGPTLQTEVGTGYAGAATVADFDLDGHDDLVIGNDFISVTDQTARGGYVTVFYGGAEGIDTTRSRVFHQDTEGVPGSDESDDSLGGALTAGDVTGDGYPDLAIGAVFESIGSATHTGNVWVLRGGASGLTTSGAQSVNQGTPGVPGGNESCRAPEGPGRAHRMKTPPICDISAGRGRDHETYFFLPWFLTASIAAAAASGSRYVPPGLSGLKSASSS
ncbi:FG-GAP and VCBS repeat-containing protein [Streptomyces sp. NPDC002896]|uniref:FG-GAP and VCBS repeat-containing protein n=1 Tax=Streptomyces sp. NPDC002896 TaxID=3154438 RepID=UPI00332F59E0